MFALSRSTFSSELRPPHDRTVRLRRGCPETECTFPVSGAPRAAIVKLCDCKIVPLKHCNIDQLHNLTILQSRNSAISCLTLFVRFREDFVSGGAAKPAGCKGGGPSREGRANVLQMRYQRIANATFKRRRTAALASREARFAAPPVFVFRARRAPAPVRLRRAFHSQLATCHL